MNQDARRTQILMGALWLGVLPWFAGGSEPIAILVTAAALLVAVLILWRSRQVAASSHDVLTYTGAALLGWGVLSLLWTVNRYQTVSWVVLWALGLTAFYIARQLRGHDTLVQQWITGYLVIATLFSAYGIGLYMAGDYNRLTSSFYWANPFAGYIIPAVLLAAWRYVREGQKFYLACAVVSLASFWLTDSRGATFILGLIVFYILATQRNKRTFWTKSLLILVLAIVVSTGASLVRNHVFHHTTIQAGSRFAQAVTGDSTSVSDRMYFARAAFDIWSKYPLAGSGAGTYGVLHPIYQGRVISASQDAHSVYIQTFAELGLVGGDLLAVIVFLLLLGIWRSLRGRGSEKVLALCILALVLHAGIDIDAKYPAFLILTAILIGLWYDSKLVSRKPLVVPVLVMVCVMVLAASLYESDALANRGLSYENDGYYSQAAGYYSQAHDLIAYNPNVLISQGINYYTLATSKDQDSATNLKLAGTLARQAMKLDPYDAQDPFLLARVLTAQGNRTSAVTEYKATLSLDSYNEPMYYGTYAELYLSEGQLSDAEIVATAGINKYPASVIANRSVDSTVSVQVSNLYLDRAAARWEAHNKNGARSDLATALRIDPSNVLAAQFQKEFR